MDKDNFQFSTFTTKSKRAFTLIELLISITIIIIFSGISFAYYNNFTEEKKLENETQKLVDVLELARKKASSGDIGNYSCNNFSGYRVSLSTTNYQLYLCCISSCRTKYIVSIYNLPMNLLISSSLNDIQFRPLANGINSSTSIVITVRNNNLNKCRQINVSPSGVIESSANSYGC